MINLRYINNFIGVVKCVKKLFLGPLSALGLKSQAHQSSEHVRSGVTEKQPAYCTNIIMSIQIHNKKVFLSVEPALSYEVNVGCELMKYITQNT